MVIDSVEMADTRFRASPDADRSCRNISKDVFSEIANNVFAVAEWRNEIHEQYAVAAIPIRGAQDVIRVEVPVFNLFVQRGPGHKSDRTRASVIDPKLVEIDWWEEHGSDIVDVIFSM